MRKEMYTLNRIPTYLLAQHYVYFQDLLYDNPRASDKTNQKKKDLYNAASADVNTAMEDLQYTDDTTGDSIRNAMQFISNIAASERQKELAFAKSIIKKFPMLQNSKNKIFNMTEDQILEDPMSFYTGLTDLLNRGRQGLTQYKDALLRLKDNINSFTNEELKKTSGAHAKPSRKEYSEDDFIYNLESELRSFINLMIGSSVKHAGLNDPESFSSKMRLAVLRIMESSPVRKKINAATDFVAMASAVYTELYSKIQHYYYEQRTSDSNMPLSQMDIDKIVDAYIYAVKKKSRKEQTVVQRALTGSIQSRDFKLITSNVSDILGIDYFTEQEQIDKQLKAIEKTNEYMYGAEGNQVLGGRLIDHNSRLKIRGLLSTAGKNLTQDIQKIHIRKFAENTAQGNMLELATSIGIDALSQQSRTISVGAAEKATDAFHFMLEIAEENPTVDAYTKVFMEQLKKVYTNDGIEKNSETAHKKSKQQQRTHKIMKLNETIDTMLKKIDQQMELSDNKDLQHMFVFHESLKEYSSVETGKSTHGFGGRELNILSAMDEIYAALEGAGVDDQYLDKELITLLSLNLANAGGEDPGLTGAIAQDARGPLMKYLSIFAGLIMFDDAVNIAKETMNELTYNHITQLHVYKLNRIYVPASFILVHIEQAVKECRNIMNGMGAKVYIDISKANDAVTSWFDKRITDPRKNGHYSYYHIGDWRQVASKVASGTKVKITFMAAFIKFIEQLLLQDQP